MRRFDICDNSGVVTPCRHGRVVVVGDVLHIPVCADEDHVVAARWGRGGALLDVGDLEWAVGPLGTRGLPAFGMLGVEGEKDVARAVRRVGGEQCGFVLGPPLSLGRVEAFMVGAPISCGSARGSSRQPP